MNNGKIKKQVEFYFSDANFRVDTFLKNQALINNGYVPIETILTFKKMKELGATLEDVKNALSDSKLVEIKDDCLKKVETDDFHSYLTQKDIDKNCLYISGFDSGCTLEDIDNILNNHMNTKLIRMRRHKNKEFSGSVFVELENENEVEKACELQIPVKETEEGVKRLKDNQSFLIIMKKVDYLSQKEKLDEEKDAKEAKENLIKDFTDKLYKFEVEGKDIEIHEIKKLISDTAFVDKERKVIRMKFKKEFAEREEKNDETTIKITKMNEEEVKNYCENIRVKPKKGVKRGKKQKEKASKN